MSVLKGQVQTLKEAPQVDTVGPPEGQQLDVAAVGHHRCTNLTQRKVAEWQTILRNTMKQAVQRAVTGCISYAGSRPLLCSLQRPALPYTRCG